MKTYYKTLHYENWQRLKADITMDICKDNRFPDNRYIFRGQSNETWKLKATFDRYYGDLPYEQRKKLENDFLEEFKRFCIDWEGQENFKNYDRLQLMSVGQHYGLPTRLLDWTYSLYIAAFFAFANATDESTNVAIWIIDKTHEIWQGEYGVEIKNCRTDENDRQKYQNGLFTLNKSPERAIDDYIGVCANRCKTEGALFKVVIPASERHIVLSDLEMMGINSFNLYRGIEGCAKGAVLKVTK